MHHVTNSSWWRQLRRSALVMGLATLIAAFTSTVVAQGVPGFPDAVVIDVDPGAVGGPASIAGGGTFAANADGVLDVFIVWEPKQLIAPPGFTYSSNASWENPAPNARYREWAGTFLHE